MVTEVWTPREAWLTQKISDREEHEVTSREASAEPSCNFVSFVVIVFSVCFPISPRGELS